MRIALETVSNARDLGGLSTYDGRHVKHGRILRTANMSMLNERDIKILKDYDLRLVLDLRTKTVMDANPNVKIEGVEYVHIPIVKDLNSRVTSKGDYENRSMADILLTFTSDFAGEGEAWMMEFYKKLYSSDYSLSQYKIFFDYLLKSTQGAVIFHCTAGKDRTGVGAILLLSLLGVKREEIIKDYLLTNESTSKEIREAQELGRQRGYEERIINDIPKVNGVMPKYAKAVLDFIDTYPTAEDFFKDKMGLDDAYICTLRKSYLE